MQSVAPGFNPEHVISMRLGAGSRQFGNPDQAAAFYQERARRISNLPGVQAVGAVTSLPFTASVGWGGMDVEGFTPHPAGLTRVMASLLFGVSATDITTFSSVALPLGITALIAM